MTTSPLPPLYSRWIEGALLGAEIPAENQATCSDCAMCARPGESPAGLATYDPTIKCCTFHPELWNFLVGRVLDDHDPASAEGRATVVARLESGIGLSPLGLMKSPAYRLLYQAGGPAEFGHTRLYRCPHYLADGRCGVWRHRESTCATWFCKYERGATGARFWKALHGLLGHVERALSTWCLLELDLGAEALAALFPPPGVPGASPNLEGKLDPASFKKVWGRWAGREQELYRAAAALVEPLSWEQVLAIGGPEVRVAVAQVQHAFAGATSDELPERLRPGPYRILEAGPSRTQVASYNPIDPITLPNTLMRLLPRFDGRPVAEVLDGIARDDRIKVTPDLVQRLVDHEVLVPAKD